MVWCLVLATSWHKQTGRLWLVLSVQFNLLSSSVWMYVCIHLDVNKEEALCKTVWTKGFQLFWKLCSVLLMFLRKILSPVSNKCLVLPGRTSQYHSGPDTVDICRWDIQRGSAGVSYWDKHCKKWFLTKLKKSYFCLIFHQNRKKSLPWNFYKRKIFVFKKIFCKLSQQKIKIVFLILRRGGIK